jgi:heparan-alpha-glucosaminide N-acetyltransferase
MNQLPLRILSIDVLRAITMFLMIFVNDVAGVANIPAWIEHTAADVDGMGFSDLIFPAFLFIVGLSLPFAIQSRKDKGAGLLSISGYIALRALALIVMGFFHVNLENYDRHSALLPYPVYTILITIGFFLVWLDYPAGLSKVKKNGFIGLGIVFIAVLALLYKGGSAENPEGLKPHWWGILGIIGWAYLVSAFVYLFSKGNIFVLMLAFVAFAAINVTVHMGIFHYHLWIIGDASSITLMMGGALITSMYKKLIGSKKYLDFWTLILFYGMLSFAFGMFIRPYAGGISKIYATPAWIFVCMGITILVFAFLIYLIDVRQKKDWFKLIKPAGTSTLTCYLIPYLLYSVFSLVHFHFPHFLSSGIGGIIRSFLIAFLVIGIVYFLEKKKLRLKV